MGARSPFLVPRSNLRLLGSDVSPRTGLVPPWTPLPVSQPHRAKCPDIKHFIPLKNPAELAGFLGFGSAYKTCFNSTGRSRLVMRTALWVLVFWSRPKMFTR